jgi:hypothetical protein
MDTLEFRRKYGVTVRITEEVYGTLQAYRRKMEDRDLVEYSIADALAELLKVLEVGE